MTTIKALPNGNIGIHVICAFKRLSGRRQLVAEEASLDSGSAIVLAIARAARLPNYRLAERLYADIDYRSKSRIHGVLYLVTTADILALDRYEGYPRTYRRLWLEVVFRNERYSSMTYEMTAATKAQRQGKPYPEDCRQLCSEGAVAHNIPNAFTTERKHP